VFAVALHTFKHLLHLLRHVAIDAVQIELDITEYRIQECAQFVAHVGEELRLVLARHFELMALDLNLAEQARLLNRKLRLRSEGLQRIHGPLRKFAGRFSAHHEGANDTIGGAGER
jgi:hypothetical protein